MNTTIQKVHAREILDSWGNPTVETGNILHDKKKAKVSIPSGTLTGKHEVVVKFLNILINLQPEYLKIKNSNLLITQFHGNLFIDRCGIPFI